MKRATSRKAGRALVCRGRAGGHFCIPPVTGNHSHHAIVPSVEWRDESTQTVDVSDALVEHFQPDDKTRGYATDLRNKPPAEI